MRSAASSCAFLLAILLSSQSVGASAPSRPKVAVLDVEPVQGVAPGTARILSALITGRVSEMGHFEVISNSEVSSMLDHERQRQLAGCSDDTGCLASIGGALGADYLLSGQVGKIGSRYSLNLSLADVRKGRVLGRQTLLCEASDDVLVDVAQQAVKALLQPLLPAAPAAPTEALPRPKPQATLQAAVPGPSYLAPGLTTALTVALVGSAVGCGLSAKKSYDDLVQAKKDAPESFDAKWEAEAPGIRQRALAADVLYGASAIAAGVTLWLWVRSASSAPSSPAVSISADHQGAAVTLTGSF